MAELHFKSRVSLQSTVRWYVVQHCIKAVMCLGSHEDSLPSHKRSLSSQDCIISGEITVSAIYSVLLYIRRAIMLGKSSVVKVRVYDLSADLTIFIIAVELLSLHN